MSRFFNVLFLPLTSKPVLVAFFRTNPSRVMFSPQMSNPGTVQDAAGEQTMFT